MAFRVTTYEQAFEGVLGVSMGDKVRAFINRLEQAGHTEKSIAFAIWKTQDKLMAYRQDNRFFSILENEINKWSWRKDDPRWKEYWKKKEEEKRAISLRKELNAIRNDEYEFKQIDKHAQKPPKRPKGYVYFIQGLCGGAIKIGYSASPEKRLKELQTGYPDTLTILLMIPGSESTEATFHRQFDASRLKGEWFRPDDYLIEQIKELKAKFLT